jgi:hypothetical protein
MYHKQRWTLDKIRQRLELIVPLVYIKRQPLPAFRDRELETAVTPPLIGIDVDDSKWQGIDAYQYWGAWLQNFLLRTTFAIPEDGDGIIIRLYESQRKRGPVQLHAGYALGAAWETNLLEENEAPLTVENDSIPLDLKPYQIMTLRLISK